MVTLIVLGLLFGGIYLAVKAAIKMVPGADAGLSVGKIVWKWLKK